MYIDRTVKTLIMTEEGDSYGALGGEGEREGEGVGREW